MSALTHIDFLHAIKILASEGIPLESFLPSRIYKSYNNTDSLLVVAEFLNQVFERSSVDVIEGDVCVFDDAPVDCGACTLCDDSTILVFNLDLTVFNGLEIHSTQMLVDRLEGLLSESAEIEECFYQDNGTMLCFFKFTHSFTGLVRAIYKMVEVLNQSGGSLNV